MYLSPYLQDITLTLRQKIKDEILKQVIKDEAADCKHLYIVLTTNIKTTNPHSLLSCNFLVQRTLFCIAQLLTHTRVLYNYPFGVLYVLLVQRFWFCCLEEHLLTQNLSCVSGSMVNMNLFEMFLTLCENLNFEVTISRVLNKQGILQLQWCNYNYNTG